MVVNISELKEAIETVIMKRLDHKNLDKDVEYFANTPSTTENLAVYIWDNIRLQLKKPELLYEVKIHETPKNIISYRGPYLLNGIYNPINKRITHDSCTNISSDSD
ncbi:6-pyruvoyl tetrahydrobiopterin synthase isoform X2 [Drosophila erecta]|nr:6-pyruvoyl tetrahydrobiopterin synthase isoform X2 [Drosophila erecta]XP_026836013.1 6-pyruvoyl tetrahydrobiopterin synthase isoform X2 [Drosophila erecta]XP_026836014.1 6-pyruvoyl tetrahydrobiopterin synthase isoform X2 [Drosophila erecta]